jgi:predicted dehydrogenase
MVDIGIHNADIVLDTIGAVNEVMAYTDTFEYDFEVEDTAVACMRFEDGMLGTFEVSWTTDPEAIEMQVVGTEGVLYADKIDEELRVELSDDRGTVDVPLPDYRSPIKRFVDAALDGEDPPVTGKEGRDALELVMAIYRAADKNTAVSLPLDTDGDDA